MQLTTQQITKTTEIPQPQLILVKDFQCPSGNPGIFVCTYNNCQQNAFMCKSLQCECAKKHSDCMFKLTDEFLKTVQSLKKPLSEQTTSSFLGVIRNYDELIAYLTLQRLNFLQFMQMFGLQQNTRQFVKMINNGQKNQIKGSLIAKSKVQIIKVSMFQKKIQQQSYLIEKQKQCQFSDLQRVLDSYVQRLRHTFLSIPVPQGNTCSQCNQNLQQFRYWCYWSSKPSDLRCRKCVEAKQQNGAYKYFNNSVLVSDKTDRVLKLRLGSNKQPQSQEGANRPGYQCNGCRTSNNNNYVRFLSLGTRPQPKAERDFEDLCQPCMDKYINGDENLRKTIKSWNHAFLRILYQKESYYDY